MNAANLRNFLLTHQADLTLRTLQHLELVALALLGAVLIGLPMALLLRRSRAAAAAFLGFAGIVQTVPSLALLSIMLPLFGLGRNTAVAALFLYALLPVIRNALVGLQSVDAATVESARGLGMNDAQLFWGVELPLAVPMIFAGLRTAAVISVGVATLSALVGAGGLGVFIFRGIATNQPETILLGAIPAALLAILLDGALALAQRTMLRRPRRVAAVVGLVLLGCVLSVWRPATADEFNFGFTPEFVQRPDGFEGWRARYELPPLRHNDLDVSLLYDAIRRGDVDAICAFTTDGRIRHSGLRPLTDDRHFFPQHEAALLVQPTLFDRLPALRPLLQKLSGALPEETMREINRRIDQDGLTPAAAASEFLRRWTHTAGINWQESRASAKRVDPVAPDLVIGARNFTEQYVLGRIIEQLIDGATAWHADLKSGLGSSAICFAALKRGQIDLYPEYSGSLLLAATSIDADPALPDRLRNSVATRAWLETELPRRHGLLWMSPLGFASSYTILVRADDPRFKRTMLMSELGALLSP